MGKLSVTNESLDSVISDFLKWEATPLTRIRVNAPVGTKIGELVDYPYRSMKLVALSNESGGTVLVQPHNCIVDLKQVNAEKDVLLKMAGDGDLYGISYLGLPDGVVPEKKLLQEESTNSQATISTAETVPPVALKRVVVFFGDSTTSRIAAQAVSIMAAQSIPMVDNSQGGTLAAYSLMAIGGAPLKITFNTDTIPARGSNVSVDGTVTYGEGVTPFSLHLARIRIDDRMEGTINGQTAAVKFFPQDSTPFAIESGRAYDVKLARQGNADGICVIGTSKNDINGARANNYDEVLERCKGYVTKMINLIEPQNSKRFILFTNWADTSRSYDKSNQAFRFEIKDAYNNWLKQSWPNQVVDLEAYILSEKVWMDTGISPTETDRTAQSNGVLPLSLSSDGGAHLLPVVEAKIVEMVIAKAKELGYL